VGAWGLLVGCEHNHASHYPPDPLLVSKRPVESHGAAAASPLLARREPPAPERLVAAAPPPEAAEGPAIPAALRPGRDDER
jgi:hypothetical protein